MKRRPASLDRREFLGGFAAAAGLMLLPEQRSRHSVTMPAQNQPGLSVPMMAEASTAFIKSLSADQRGKAIFGFGDEQRYDWNFVPKARKGLPLKDLAPDQHHLLMALLGSGLGLRGLIKVGSIMSLEPILRDIEKGAGPIRDSQLYYVTIFGDPATHKGWGWRFEGHHVSLNYAIIDDRRVASTPSFLGSNPAEVMHGPRAGLRVHAREEDLARTFVKSLEGALRTQAVIADASPREILTTNSRKADPLKPAGLAAKKLSQKQVHMLAGILDEYASNMPVDIAAQRMERIRAAGMGNVHFAWAGSLDKGQGHYYRIQGPTFLIEYDNTQNNANHIHTVWRDFTGDWGQDSLALHYQDSHHERIA